MASGTAGPSAEEGPEDQRHAHDDDLAFAEDFAAPKNPHMFMIRIDSTSALVRQIAFGAQDQLATFLASNGATVILPEPARFFEYLTDLGTLEDLDYIP